MEAPERAPSPCLTMMVPSHRRRRRLAFEVVQTSAMDCGPAALKCLLEGFGVPASYGRLREACQTDVDGTSIDTLEEVAAALGLDAEQIMLPLDHLLLPEARALPAILVVKLPSGYTHFVVVWARHRGLVQVMDPAVGRRFTTRRGLLEEAYVHTATVSAAAFRAWAGSAEFTGALKARLFQLGATSPAAEHRTAAALEDASWRSIAALDAAVRMAAALVRSGGVAAGDQASRLIEALWARARWEEAGAEASIPGAYWTVQPVSADEEGERLGFRGAVLVRVRGRTAPAPLSAGVDSRPPLSPALAAAIERPEVHPGRALLSLLSADGWRPLAALSAGLLLGAGGVLVQALIFRSLIDLGHILGAGWERLGAIGAALVFIAALILIELPVASVEKRVGRGLEIRFRVAFLEALPRLADRYFSSRPVSDMAHRGHEIHLLRRLPELAGRAARHVFELLATLAGIVWLAPESAPIAIGAAAASVAVPLGARSLLGRWELRMRTHEGGLASFYLDAMLGLLAIRTHGAGRSVRLEHEALLVSWTRAARGFHAAILAVGGVQSVVGFGLAAWLLSGHVAVAGPSGSVLLLSFWALNLPVLGSELALIAQQAPLLRNTTLRLLEPLGAVDQRRQERSEGEAALAGDPSGVAISMRGVAVRATGHTLIADLDLEIQAGLHVAVIGPSGAGKTSLAGLLLGWNRPSAGEILVDGRPLSAERLERLLRHAVWVDPATQLWNRPLLSNLRYGAPARGAPPLSEILHQAELISLLEHLPEGLQAPLGEGGGLVSGGEGQRVRLGRAMHRPRARLVILDEPFRGLDRDRRRALLRRARSLWSGATLLCITHDLEETRDFERVLVLEGGRIVEDGAPGDLAANEGSRYSALLQAETVARETLWRGGGFRRLRIAAGRLTEDGGGWPP